MWCMIILFLGQSIAVNHVYSLSIPGNGRGCDPSCWSRATSISNFIWVTGATKSCIFTLTIYSLVLIYQKKLRQRWSKTKLLILFSHDKKRLSDLEHTFGNSQNFCWFSENFVSWLYLFWLFKLGAPVELSGRYCYDCLLACWCLLLQLVLLQSAMNEIILRTNKGEYNPGESVYG